MSPEILNEKRAKDSDRDAVITILDAALADGQINESEYHERIDEVLNTQSLHTLQQMTADLQVEPTNDTEKKDGQPHTAGSFVDKAGEFIVMAASFLIPALIVISVIGVLLWVSVDTVMRVNDQHAMRDKMDKMYPAIEQLYLRNGKTYGTNTEFVQRLQQRFPKEKFSLVSDNGKFKVTVSKDGQSLQLRRGYENGHNVTLDTSKQYPHAISD